MPSTTTSMPAKVKIELSSDLLRTLIYQGQIKGNDCKCLDNNAKQVLWQSLLNVSTLYKEV
ncbi:hypothetical protein HII17_11660 [Thalassotalea sp. M1531]|uniref:Uncharacterized protein n=1 Tax=Thalassotalea algicola TaxID=2716224 RepID=A0A7Y0Q8J4_9GAMM|nr:hypothetical protein [Thalassotalea algicola]NMP32225.1 hypothetical protein [Thalassotalea algicola]